MLRAAPPVLGSGRHELPLLSHALARHAAGPRAGQHAAHERRASTGAAAGEGLTMAKSSPDVVIVGGGIAGMTTAYYLAKSGVPSVVVERDAIGCHASGFAYGGLSPLSGFGIPGPMAEIAQDGMRLHRELSKSLLDETGIDVDFRIRSSLALAFTEVEVRRLRTALPWQQKQPGYAVRWLDIAEARKVEPRISDETLGAVLT